MTTTDTKVNQLVINRLTKTQFNGASPSSTEIYAVDPEFVGGKLLKTNSDGDIVETNETIPTDTNDLTNGAGFITGITSGDVTTALGYTPYNSSNPNGYTSNVGTVTSVNNTSPDGSGNVSISVGDTLPSQSGQNGKFLTTDGSSTSWASVGGSSLPSQTGHSGEFLTTDGTDASWAAVDALPSQTGQSGKFLTTDGTDASWASVSVPVKDNLSITENSSNQLQTVGVIDQRDTTTALKQWSGTKAQYDSIVSKDSDTIYNVKDEPNTFQSLLETIYPVGSIYIGTMAICPMSALFGTWTLVSSGRVLQGADANHSAGSTIEAGLPDSSWRAIRYVGIDSTGNSGGASTGTATSSWGLSQGNNTTAWQADYSLSNSNSIYGNSTTVQPPAFVVNIWQRTA